MKNPNPLWFPSSTPVWCCKIVSSKGGGQSVLGASPEEASALASDVVKRLGTAKWMATEPFPLSESKVYSEVWDMTPPPDIASVVTEYTKGQKDE